MKTTLTTILIALAASLAQGQDHLLTGTVISFHSDARIFGSGGDVVTIDRRVYVLKTADSIMEIAGAGGWGKRLPLTVGEVVQCHRGKRELLFCTLEDGKEHRYRILSEEQTK